MKSSLFVSIVLLTAPTAFATAEHPSYSAGGAQDLLNNTSITQQNSDSANNPTVKISASCTNSAGTELKASDAGYESCLRAHQSTSGRPLAPGKQQAGVVPTATVKFGSP